MFLEGVFSEERSILLKRPSVFHVEDIYFFKETLDIHSKNIPHFASNSLKIEEGKKLFLGSSQFPASDCCLNAFGLPSRITVLLQGKVIERKYDDLIKSRSQKRDNIQGRWVYIRWPQ